MVTRVVMYHILSKISNTLIVQTPKYVIFSRSNCSGHGNFEGFPLSNYNRTVLRLHVRVRTCRVPSAKLLAVKVDMRKVLHEFVVVFVYHLYSVGEIVMDSWL